MYNPVMNAKQQVRKLLERLPDDCSLQDVQYHLYVVRLLHSRARLADEGQFISQQEAERRMAKWTR